MGQHSGEYERGYRAGKKEAQAEIDELKKENKLLLEIIEEVKKAVAK